MKKTLAVVTILGFLVTMGCESMTREQKGAVIGAGGGAVLGGLIGHAADETALGLLLGTAIGGLAGAYIGDYMDEQAQQMKTDLQNMPGTRVRRVGDGILVTFDSDATFASESSTLTPEAQTTLREIAGTLKEYKDTKILIQGFTDSRGSEDYNRTLSLNRAQAVASYLAEQGVNPLRFTTIGMGESHPVASNTTPEGRARNRRVEIGIFANQKLQERARERS
ncbi:MAG: OmpA family protein [Nitrospirota bacterium]|jgi:outer membrane protein OmpA-like peptidoglycan-associated protein